MSDCFALTDYAQTLTIADLPVKPDNPPLSRHHLHVLAVGQIVRLFKDIVLLRVRGTSI
jgi:hypothetical protein